MCGQVCNLLGHLAIRDSLLGTQPEIDVQMHKGNLITKRIFLRIPTSQVALQDSVEWFPRRLEEQ
jgi:hypothetical protein